MGFYAVESVTTKKVIKEYLKQYIYNHMGPFMTIAPEANLSSINELGSNKASSNFNWCIVGEFYKQLNGSFVIHIEYIVDIDGNKFWKFYGYNKLANSTTVPKNKSKLPTIEFERREFGYEDEVLIPFNLLNDTRKYIDMDFVFREYLGTELNRIITIK